MFIISECLHSWLKGYHGKWILLSKIEDNNDFQHTLYTMFRSLSLHTKTLSDLVQISASTVKFYSITGADMNNIINNFLDLIGFNHQTVSHKERLITSFGGFCGILGVYFVSNTLLDAQAAAMMVASMGASAVLLYAVPHSPLAQPWNVMGGHLISALIGVSCARFIPDMLLAAALSVGCAIAAMHYLRCIHPPGGATALSAVIGGPMVHAMGYGYVLQPVLINAIVILGIAIVFNALFNYYRYPALHAKKVIHDDHYPPIAHADLVYALSQIDTLVTVSEEDLLTIYELATGRDKPASGQDQE
jgi:CBS-domain-containing membrane protein